MPVPTQRQMHKPILEALNSAAGGMHVKDIGASVADALSLSESERTEKTQRGTPMFKRRMQYALSVLTRDELVRSQSRGWYEITSLGINSLPAPPPPIDPRPDDVIPSAKRMDNLYTELNNALADELSGIVKGLSPSGFERLVVNLLEVMGYGKGLQVGDTWDQGIDGVINQDPLGLEKVYIQAKRWQSSVGGPQIRNFSGSLDLKGAIKGVFITTSSFTANATATADSISRGNKSIILVDGVEIGGTDDEAQHRRSQ